MTETAPVFDYVIVGAGSAGCVLADRLSANGRYSVCLLEAGGSDADPRIKIPLGLINLIKNPKFDWCFSSAPHAHLGERVVPIPRGKTLGGSGSINSMVYIRGRASDYDGWQALGADGWSWQNVLPYFMQQECNARWGDGKLHGDSGPLHVQNLPSPHELLEVFQQAGESQQIPRNADFNGEVQEGLGVYQTTMQNGRRWSAADAFLRPALKRANCSLFTHAKVEQINLKDRAATSISVKSRKGNFDIKVGRELILCAGAIGSPALLLKSGIGPAEHLRDMGITVELDLFGVGKNLHDHPAVAVFHGGGSVGYGLSLSALPTLAMAPFQYLLTRRGLFASNTVEGGGFAKTNPQLTEPDVQFHFIPARLGHQQRMIVWGRGYYCDVCLLKPKSRGELRLKSGGNELDINLNLLAEEDDHQRLLDGLMLLRRIMSAPAFDIVRSEELAPGPKVVGREQLDDYLQQRLGTAYHPVGSCRMGAKQDKHSVVAPDLRLVGTNNIRVIDASIMPEVIAGNTNAPTMMIAEKGAAIIKASVGSS